MPHRTDGGAVLESCGRIEDPGEISPIVKTTYGYHVLQFVDRKPDTHRSFDDVGAALVDKLRNDWIDKQVVEHTGQMRGKPLDANPDLVASLRERYLPPGAVTPEQALKAAAAEAAAKKAAEKDGAAQH